MSPLDIAEPMFSELGYRYVMPVYVHPGIIEELRMAIEHADRDGTAALNGLIYGAMLTVGASMALVGIGGFGGIIAWLLAWLCGLGMAAVWVAPHLVEVQRGERRRTAERQASIEAVRRTAVDILLDDDTPEDERLSVAMFLIHDER